MDRVLALQDMTLQQLLNYKVDKLAGKVLTAAVAENDDFKTTQFLLHERLVM